jgi:hypothetical protein
MSARSLLLSVALVALTVPSIAQDSTRPLNLGVQYQRPISRGCVADGVGGGTLNTLGQCEVAGRLLTTGDATFLSNSQVNGNQNIGGNSVVSGNSTTNGTLTANSQTNLNGNLFIGGQTTATGKIFGSITNADNAIRADTAAYADVAGTAGFATTSGTATFATNAGTAQTALRADTATRAETVQSCPPTSFGSDGVGLYYQLNFFGQRIGTPVPIQVQPHIFSVGTTSNGEEDFRDLVVTVISFPNLLAGQTLTAQRHGKCVGSSFATSGPNKVYYDAADLSQCVPLSSAPQSVKETQPCGFYAEFTNTYLQN